MATGYIWSTSSIQDINEGVVANDGSGDTIRDAFLKVDENFYQVSHFLSNTNVGFLGATISDTLTSTNGNITSLLVGNIRGTTSTFTGNITAGNIIANTGIYNLGVTSLIGETYLSNITSSGTATIAGNVYVAGTIVPSVPGINLGSPTNPFGNVYGTLINTVQNLPSVDSGLFKLHNNFDPVFYAPKDIGIFGKYYANASNNYAFFGYQTGSDNFVYKLTPTDHTLGGETAVNDGVYGNVQFGSLFLSNTNPTTANTLIVAGDANVLGNLYVNSNIYSAGNSVITTATIDTMVVTGNVIGNLNVTGTLFSDGSPLLSVNTAGPYNLFSGGIVLGNILATSLYDSTSQSTGAVVVSGGIGAGGNIYAAGFVGPYYGTIQTANQPNITGLGSLGNLTVINRIQASQLQATSLGVTTITAGGAISAGTLAATGTLTAGSVITGAVNATTVSATTIGNTSSTVNAGTVNATTVNATTYNGNVVGSTGNFTNLIANNVNARTIGNTGTTLTGTLSTNAQPNINSVGTLSGLNVSGITALTGTATLNGVALATLGGSASFSSVNGTPIGNVTPATGAFTNITGNIVTAAQPLITSIGATGLTVAGNTAVNNTLYGRGIYDNGNRVLSTTTEPGNLTISGTSVSMTLIGPGATGAGSSTNVPVVRTDAYGRVISLSTQSVSSTFGVAGTTTTGAATMVSSGVTTGVLSFAGTFGVTAAVTTANSTSVTVNISTPQDIRTTAIPQFTGLLPTGNLTCDLGSTSLWWNNIYGNAIRAKYADLAECYESDEDYAPGTVVIFGGEKEITISTQSHDDRIAGVVSTDPAYLMNAEGGLPIALTGRVPCQVIGPISKGDKLVASGTPGYAMRLDKNLYEPGCIIGKSLEDFIGAEGIIEVVVGRL